MRGETMISSRQLVMAAALVAACIGGGSAADKGSMVC